MTSNISHFQREMLFGRWYRKDKDELGNQIVEYAQMSEDGSFEFTFATFDKSGNVVEQVTELGDWGLVADIHFTLTKGEIVEQQEYAADLNNADNYHAYQVLQLTHQIFQYQHLVTGDIYQMRRVLDEVGHC